VSSKPWCTTSRRRPGWYAQKREWTRLEDSTQQAPGHPYEGFSVRAIYELQKKTWARNTVASKLSAQTLCDREAYWKELEPLFGATHIDGLASEHIRRSLKNLAPKVRKLGLEWFPPVP
jgi:hypothetical protein